MPFWGTLIILVVISFLLAEVLRRERKKLALTPQQKREAYRLSRRGVIAYILFVLFLMLLVVVMDSTVGIGYRLGLTLELVMILGLFLTIYWMMLGCYKQAQKHESTS